MSLVPCEPTGSRCSTPGFTPGSLPVLLPIPGPPQSHSIALVQTDLLIVSTRTSFTVSLHLTLSLFPLIALLRRGPSRLLNRLLVTAFLKGNVSPIPIFPEIFPPHFQILLSDETIRQGADSHATCPILIDQERFPPV